MRIYQRPLSGPVFAASTVALLALLLTGCSQQARSPYPYQKDAAALEQALSGVAVLGHPVTDAELPAKDVLEMDAEMRAFVKRWIGNRQRVPSKIRNLLNAIESRGVLGVRFNEAATGTAKQAYYSGAANCVAFSNLIVAMAREAGMTARYQNVLVMPKWELEGDLANLQRHINVKIRVPRAEDYVVDFSPDSLTAAPLEATRISDAEAAAQYYNNIAINHLHAQDYKQAFLYVRKALHLAPDSSFIWSNLGVILGRAGADDGAEAALQHAVTQRPLLSSALANLAALYTRRGETERAAYYTGEIARHRSKNPYFLLLEAREAFAKNDFADTLGILRRAQAIKPEEALFFELQSRAYIGLEKHDKAVAALRKALKYAGLESQRDSFIVRLEALTGKPVETPVNEPIKIKLSY